MAFFILSLTILGWLAFSYAFVSFCEHQIHRHMMHRKRFPAWVYRFSPYILDTFEAHAVQHHSQYYNEFDHEPTPEGKEFNLDIKVGETVVMLVTLAPVIGALLWFSPLGGSILIGVTILHNRLWNVLHREMHMPNNAFFKNSRVFRFLARHHFLHHSQTSKNFNVVFPLADYLFGSVARPRYADVKEMLRLGYLQPRHSGTLKRLELWRKDVAQRRLNEQEQPAQAA